jgi:hypothetical protein
MKRPRATLAIVVLGAFIVCGCLGGCLGNGGAVNARWRIIELANGDFYDPRDIADQNGVCCEPIAGQPRCGGSPAWRIERVRVQLADPTTGLELPDPPSGLIAQCGDREFTTPFSLPAGQFAINLIGDAPALSPIPEVRTIIPTEIVTLDVVALSIPATTP